jgi:IclR family transcriptional regulator, acetate operon repressor
MTHVQSVERAIAILRCLASGDAGVSEIAQRVGLPKSTVSRLLATLHEAGAVTQNGGGYRLGPLITELATSGQHDGLIALARPYLAALVETFGEDAGVAVLDHGDTLYLDQCSADAAVQLRDWTGERAPPHTVSSGLVLLAHASPDECQRVLAGPLVRLTSRTMVAPAKLRRRLAAVAVQGSEWVYGEFAEDINSVAAPVFGSDGAVVAALHVHGPSYRFPGKRDPAPIAAAVAAAAQRMSARFTR